MADSFKGDDKQKVTVRPLIGEIILTKGLTSHESQPLAGVTARVEEGEALKRRLTATRMVALGVFSLAFLKKKGGESFLTIEGEGFFWSVEVGRKDKNSAMKFAAKVNDRAKKAAAAATR